MIRVVIVDDHPLMRQGVRSLLEKETDISVVGEAGDGEEALKLIREQKPDIVLMDLEMPGMDGLEATSRVREENPGVRVLVLTIHGEKEYVEGLLRAGAAGYILKTAYGPSLVESVRLASLGETVVGSRAMTALLETRAPSEQMSEAGPDVCVLTEEQKEMLRWMANGMTGREMARLRGVSERTMKGYVSHLLHKLGVSSRAWAVAVAMKVGILSEEDVEVPGKVG